MYTPGFRQLPATAHKLNYSSKLCDSRSCARMPPVGCSQPPLRVRLLSFSCSYSGERKFQNSIIGEARCRFLQPASTLQIFKNLHGSQEDSDLHYRFYGYHERGCHFSSLKKIGYTRAMRHAIVEGSALILTPWASLMTVKYRRGCSRR